MRPMIKLFSQFEHVANATPFALREDGNISDGIAQGTCADFGVSIASSGTRGKNLSSKTGLGIDRNIWITDTFVRSTYGSP